MGGRRHWEQVYARTSEERLGWFQEKAEPSLQLIRKTGISPTERIIDIGSGASRLIDNLLAEGYENIIATDISPTALDITRKRLSHKDLPKVKFLTDDITAPTALFKLQEVSLWHDRAVLHFFTEEKDKQTYKKLLNRLVPPGKFVVLATFHTTGAKKCSGLPVFRYNKETLEEFLGEEYLLLEPFHFTYINPSGGERPYIYTLFQRRK